ncbi:MULTISPECIES: galactokinase [Alteromonas]|jgi:galactokinase|uniref:Galactokinase n=5 Tax=root TaxID=1 RepID=A0A126PV12_ALTMA|nr:MULTISPECIES: galactokinase [Alteromonas]MEC7700078.1 galactokinase [Pseudomonadota bacterium]NKX30408.1 galactokinase [Alteromonadaceae bacterium A_SAG1]AMJ96867.1 galactokinase [Alteromonas macleodii]MEC8749751.1 galactokinase [Pseudomonadota bacterium]MEE3056108.1 galactokinase [Pseudomonadota bacterium]|tara:strand:+ start:569 stop:1711 length:1143 start_codon:yes stop_codon:yes gene_type:complete
MDNQVLSSNFETHYGEAPALIAHAPGRVNIIGEHTDYNEGFVFPAAINFGTWVAATKRADNDIVVTAMDYENQQNQFSLSDINYDEEQGWANYVRGVVKVLKEAMPDFGGANLLVTGNVPQGAGLSSSASFEVAILKALSALYELPLDGVQAALLGQKAENTFVGCSCGIMDQLISAMGNEGMAMLLDCQSLAIEHSPLPDSHQIVIINSNVKRGLVDSEYNLRRQQCEQGASLLGVSSLREATMEMLEGAKAHMPEVVYRRAKHIVTENARTLAASQALKAGDIETVSEAMAQSHISMRDDFEITVRPIDYLVEIIGEVLGKSGGVRMTGGGFGGCVVALVPTDKVEAVKQVVADKYSDETGYSADIYVCTATQGAFAV